MKKNLLLIYGGGGTEHDISIVSSKYLIESINKEDFNIVEVEIAKDASWVYKEQKVQLDFNKDLVINAQKKISIDFVVPCVHGFPGETGDLQSYFELIKLPYLGCNSESSKICFNKALTKLWLDKVGINTTPFIILSEQSTDSISEVKKFFVNEGPLFVKASNQGSSVGCYPLIDIKEVDKILKSAFELSDFVIIEKSIMGRELEVSTFEYKDQVHATKPGEIICPNKFYSFEEKYNKDSHTETFIEAKDLTSEQVKTIQDMAIKAFKTLKLSDLSRIDFFLTNDNKIYINEINTFPGLTPISMFPKMMENYGVKFKDYLSERFSLLK